MATYTYTDPSASLRDYVRLLVRDNQVGKMILSDEDIAALVLSYPLAAIPSRAAYSIGYEAAAILFAHWSRQASATVGPLKIEADKRAAAAFELVKLLYNQSKGLPPDGSMGLVMFSGAMTLDKIDRPLPVFTRILPL